MGENKHVCFVAEKMGHGVHGLLVDVVDKIEGLQPQAIGHIVAEKEHIKWSGNSSCYNTS